MTHESSLEIAIILPAYNEALTVGPTIEGLFQHLPTAYFVVVNNNSSDRTREIASETIARLGAAGVVLDEPRQGKANAVRRAFSNIDADIYLLTDADETYPADQANELIQPVINGQADMVVGDRQSHDRYRTENKRPLHNFGNGLVRRLVNGFFDAQLVDVMSGYRAFNRNFVRNYPIIVEGFEIETDMTLHALDKRFRILEIPIRYKDRPPESFSKLNTFSDGARVIFTFAQVLRYYRPMFFFGGTALIFFLLGLLAAGPVFSDWFTFRFIYHVPLAILAAAFELAAILALSVGLVLDAIRHQHRMDFERSLRTSMETSRATRLARRRDTVPAS